MTIILLYILGPVIGLTYKVLDHYGFWERLSGRKYVKSALSRMKSGSGYPHSYLFVNEPNDRIEFNAVRKRVRKYTRFTNVRKNFNKKELTAFAIGPVGQPFPILGVDQNWPQEHRRFFSGNHPIIISFSENPETLKGIGGKCATINELEEWVQTEKRSWDFYAGVVVISFFSIASILFRLQVLGKN